MDLAPLPLTRRLQPTEVVDAAVWFIRGRAAAWVVLSGTPALLVALALPAYISLCSTRAAGTTVEDFLTTVRWAAAGLSALLLARGVGLWAASEYFRIEAAGGTASIPGCLFAGLRRAPAALFLHGIAMLGAVGGAIVGFYPGLASVNAWCVAIPAAVNEPLDAPSALARSSSLMKGSYAGMQAWIVCLVLQTLVFINLLMIGSFMPEVLRILLGYDLPTLSVWTSPGNPVFLALTFGLSIAAGDVMRSAAFCVLYLNARTEREGNDLLVRLKRLAATRGRAVEEAALG